MQTEFARHLPLSGTYNVRDLGGYPAGEGRTRWRQVLRADAPHRLDADGVAMLVAEGLRTVIDLRHGTEVAAAANPFSTHGAVRYINISLFDNIAPPTPNGDDAVDVLLELYTTALERRAPAIREVVMAIADSPEGVVMFHCTAGKDRTGIIAALLLALIGVDRATIRDDYALTARMIAPMIAELVEGAKARGADVEAFKPLLAADPSTIDTFLTRIEQRHGSVANYLESIGVDGAARDRLRRRLIEDASEAAR